MSSLIIIIIDILWRWEFQAMTKKKSYIEITYIKCFSVESMILFHYSFPHTSVKKWSLKHVNFCSRRILDDSNLLFNSNTFSTVQFNIQYCKITQIVLWCGKVWLTGGFIFFLQIIMEKSGAVVRFVYYCQIKLFSLQISLGLFNGGEWTQHASHNINGMSCLRA